MNKRSSIFHHAGLGDSILPEALCTLVAGTRLATPDGPRAVETLAVGDRVETRDGPRAIVRVGATVTARQDWTFRRAIWPVRVPVGSLGNPAPIRLGQEQRVMLAGGAIEAAFGRPEIGVRLGDLVGLRGVIIERPLASLRRHGLSFGASAWIRAEGAQCEVDGADEDGLDRDRVRDAFLAMQAVGEPPLYRS